MAKKRLDVALTEQGLAESRQKAQAIIMAGLVYVNGQKVDKAGAPVAEDAVIGENAIVGAMPQGDEKGVATIGPGVQVGANAKIGPNAMVRENVKDGDEQW